MQKMKRKLKWVLALCIMIFLASCGGSPSTDQSYVDESQHEFGQAVDQEGNAFKTIQIGDMLWMAENLNVSSFRNGDPIPKAETKEEWLQAARDQKPAWCYYDNDPEKGSKYGKLYNWFAVNDPRGIGPEGWEVPSAYPGNDALHWNKLIESVGGLTGSGNKLKTKKGWQSGNGNNESGFSALPGGLRNTEMMMTPENSGTFAFLGDNGYFWSSTQFFTSAYAITINRHNHHLMLSHHAAGIGFSVRLVKSE